MYGSRGELEGFSKTLCNFLSDLPQELQPTTQNITFRAESESFTCFVMLHTIWHQLQCDLYRLVVPRIREAVSQTALLSIPPEFVAYCQRKCFQWAVKLLEFWSSAYHVPNRQRVLDCFFGVCAYQATQVIRQLRHLYDGIEIAERLHTQLAEVLEMLKEIENDMPFVRPYVCDHSDTRLIVVLMIEQVKDITTVVANMTKGTFHVETELVDEYVAGRNWSILGD